MRKTFRPYLRALLVWSLLCVIFIIITTLNLRAKTTNQPFSRIFKILIYGTFYTNILFSNFENHICPKSTNYELKRSNNVEDFDAVILHFYQHDEFMSKYRHPKYRTKRVMIVFSHEPPFFASKKFTYDRSSTFFNVWVVSFYKSSYFYYPFLRVERVKERQMDEDSLIDEFNHRKPSSFAVISNCQTSYSIRMPYIAVLEKYFPVHTYGSCYSRLISDNERRSELSVHMFFLAFENSQCREYLTEKYRDAIDNGAIPVVMGFGKNLTNIIPGSYINVFDFDNPQKLAKHLLLVASNFTEYSRYFSWRRTYHITPGNPDPTCNILEKLKKSVTGTVNEDPTVHKITDIEGQCLTTSEVRNLIMKNYQ